MEVDGLPSGAIALLLRIASLRIKVEVEEVEASLLLAAHRVKCDVILLEHELVRGKRGILPFLSLCCVW